VAHQIIKEGATTMRYLRLSACECPDSQKVAVWTDSVASAACGRSSAPRNTVDYYDREKIRGAASPRSEAVPRTQAAVLPVSDRNRTSERL
jgi:hypothetical protein